MSLELGKSSPAVLVTGASGFVGSAMVRHLNAMRRPTYGATRSHSGDPRARRSPDLSPDADWLPLLQDIDVVIHTAARVHVMNDRCTDPLAEFRAINVAGTLRLARQAAAIGVRRFIFISSIKVNGEMTEAGKAYSATDVPCPVDPYGISKAEAEAGLLEIAAETGMQVVIIRPVLVYGPGVKGNFQSMMRWLERGIPLPMGNIKNKRSLLSLSNLVDLIIICIDHPAAANQIFLAADGDDLSTSDLLRMTSISLGVKPRLFSVPTEMLTSAASWLGRAAAAQRLCSSLQVDISKTCSLLDWRPPVSVGEGLRQTAQWFLADKYKKLQ